MTTPLWEVMTRARYESADLGEHVTLAVAAEIRAMRDWLVPEEANKPEGFGVIRHAERQRLRDLLTAEAERAEWGEAK